MKQVLSFSVILVSLPTLLYMSNVLLVYLLQNKYILYAIYCI